MKIAYQRMVGDKVLGLPLAVLSTGLSLSQKWDDLNQGHFLSTQYNLWCKAKNRYISAT